MTAGATWSGDMSKLRRAHEAAVDGALRAAAEVPRSKIVRRLMQGYTTGAYKSGAAGVAGSVTISAPVTEDGVRVVRIGTNVLTDRPSPKYGERISYPMAWELGHFNLFTGNYERVEIWGPAVAETRHEQATTFARVYREVMSREMGRGAT